MTRLTVFLVAALVVPRVLASQLACPKVAPAGWGIGPKSLESVRVMSYPTGTVPGDDREYYATPPWEERDSAGLIYQTWYVNRDPGQFKYEVDCVYAETPRYVSLDVRGASVCMARWRARHDHGVVPRSLEFHCMRLPPDGRIMPGALPASGRK